jgi:hypothetical protein
VPTVTVSAVQESAELLGADELGGVSGVCAQETWEAVLRGSNQTEQTRVRWTQGISEMHSPLRG